MSVDEHLEEPEREERDSSLASFQRNGLVLDWRQSISLVVSLGRINIIVPSMDVIILLHRNSTQQLLMYAVTSTLQLHVITAPRSFGP